MGKIIARTSAALWVVSILLRTRKEASEHQHKQEEILGLETKEGMGGKGKAEKAKEANESGRVMIDTLQVFFS